MKYFSHLNSAVQILNLYQGQEPFHHFIKNFFRLHKKFGARDRKNISHLCYCYFRLGQALMEWPIEQRVIIALFLSSSQNSELLSHLKPDWNELAHLHLEEKMAFLPAPFSPTNIFPFTGKLSDGVDSTAFGLSHLQQPDLFLRIRPGYKQVVISKLDAANVQYNLLNESCVGVANLTNIEPVVALNKEAVVQDYSSQQVGEMIKWMKENKRVPEKVWDCCAASGGKSIMVRDILGEVDLTVSDIRESILANLKKRFAVAGIRKYASFRSDLTQPLPHSFRQAYDLIIADVPCSGSGTWGRTPEQLSFFTEAAIDEYNVLQRKIVSNVIPCLKEGGHLLYITCSVFKKENEEMAAFIQERFHLEMVRTELLKGYPLKADTMFAALFTSSAK